jgi:outer membrane protein TolC
MCLVAVVVAVSGCTQMHELWNTPIGDLLPSSDDPNGCISDGCVDADWVVNQTLTDAGAANRSPNDLPPVTDRVDIVSHEGLAAESVAWPHEPAAAHTSEEPIYTLTEPVAIYEPQVRSEGKLRRMMRRARRQWRRDNRPSLSERLHDVWSTPLIDLPVPFAGTITDWWNEPVLWAVDPPEDFIDHTPYRHWATQIDYPDVASPPVPVETFAAEPRRLRNPQKDAIWDMPLEQAIQIALTHSHIIRSSGQFLNPANPLLTSPDFVASSLDPAIQETGVLFGQRGVEAALSEFDAQFTTSMIWGRDERIQNTAVGTGVPQGDTLTQETGAFSAGITKRLATGGVVGVIHDWNYLGSNVNGFSPSFNNPLLFPSTYTGRVRLEARQPLWAGAGTEYTRIAGPITDQIQGVTGVQQGVVIARINNDIELADFELAIRDLVRDVESLYWQLYISYQRFDNEMRLLSEAIESYQNVQALVQTASPLAGALEESDAIEFVYQMQSRVDQARDNLYDVEAQLRRIIGLPVNDGRVIRPVEEPTIAELVPDWQVMLGTALSSRVELRKQKWNIKQLSLQLRAAEHLVKPRLDLVAAYQVNGFGDRLLGDTDDGVTDRGLGNAYATMTRGDQTGWNIGLEFSVPFGLRFAHTQVKNIEFRLAKAHAALAEAEKEISHELAHTFRELDRSYLQMRTNYNRKRTAARKVEAVRALHRSEPERYTEQAILQALDQFNQIEQEYLQSVVEYNLALMELNYRAGSLLAMNNVHLTEGAWTLEAEADVWDRAMDRQHSTPTLPIVEQRPEAFAAPAVRAPLGPPVESAGPAFTGWSPPVEDPGSPWPAVQQQDETPSLQEEQAPLPPALQPGAGR